MRTALMVFLLVLAGHALAGDEIYRWVDRDGVIHYGAQPPQKDAKPATLPPLQTYPSRGGQRALPFAAADAGRKDALVREVRILAPVQDEIFRDAQNDVSVAVAVLPALPAGAGVVFYLDGKALNPKPSASTNTVLRGLERGEHTVTAAVLDNSGKELLRAAPITFHSKPPTAR